METIKEILMVRDSLSEMDADNLIEKAKKDFDRRMVENKTLDDADFCSNWFGLEPDYILEFLEV